MIMIIMKMIMIMKVWKENDEEMIIMNNNENEINESEVMK